MTNQQKGAKVGSRRYRTLGLGAGGIGLACLLLATPPASAAAAALTLNSTSPVALATAMPETENCPQQAPTQPVPPVPAAMDTARCPPTITGRLLGLAARKAGEFLSVPILVL